MSERYKSNPNYIYTTKYTDFELSTNRHPEARVKIPGKPGYNIKLLELTVNMYAQYEGNAAYCTFLLDIDGKMYNPNTTLSTKRTVSVPINVAIGKKINTSNDVMFYLHLKTSNVTSKAIVKSFQIDYEYISKNEPSKPAQPAQPAQPQGDNLEYLIYISGNDEDVEKAIAEIKKELKDNATVETYSKR